MYVGKMQMLYNKLKGQRADIHIYALAEFTNIINSKLSKSNYTWISLYNLLLVSWGDIGLFLKMHRSIIGLDIRSQSAFTAFRALLPSANSSAEGVIWLDKAASCR